MDSLHHALTRDALGEPTARHLVVASRDWDEIKLWSDEVYMPYTVRPTGKARRPDSSLYAAAVGGFTLTRFHYRIPITVDDFSPEAGMAMVLTSLHGVVRHWRDDGSAVETGVGESYLVDPSHTPYRADFDLHHLQLNLVFPQQLLADLHLRWYGEAADERMWRQTLKFGGAQSSWMGLLAYCARCVTDQPEQTDSGPLGRHLEEQLGLYLLSQWRAQLALNGGHGVRRAPTRRDVDAAAHYLRTHAARVPTVSEVALAVGVPASALRKAFATAYQMTPMAFLTDQRLQGARAALLAAPAGATVGMVAQDWGFSSVMMFSVAYQRRFNEWPSQALRRLRAH